MTATIAQVRVLTGDTASPYIFSDTTVQEELDAAEEYLDVQTSTALGIRAHKLQAAIFIVSNSTGNISDRVAKRIKEADAELEFEDLKMQVPAWQEELDNILAKLIDLPFATVYDSF
ncbi:MAG: hypothetical protein KAJ03_11025 [Gammaproteobacteria bacterium]|nr:hypothetical protein [Gammaproteobacteria bacterium]